MALEAARTPSAFGAAARTTSRTVRPCAACEALAAHEKGRRHTGWTSMAAMVTQSVLVMGNLEQNERLKAT